jgi:hypothetical protein
MQRRLRRRILSLAHWICAGWLVSVVACPGDAQEPWTPFSRAPRIRTVRAETHLAPTDAALKSAFSRHNSLVSDVLTVQAACEIQGERVVCRSGTNLDEFGAEKSVERYMRNGH